jgi:hypothetical protein
VKKRRFIVFKKDKDCDKYRKTIANIPETFGNVTVVSSSSKQDVSYYFDYKTHILHIFSH